MSASRLQINFERLLKVCEKQASDGDERDRWRLQKYVDDLQENIKQLTKQSCSKVHPEVLKDYQKRVDLLKGVLKAEQMSTPSERLKVADTLPVPKQTSSIHVNANSKPSQSKEVLLHTKAKFSNASRQALLGEGGDGLRQRGGAQSESDLDSMIQYHHQVQEKIADDMVHLARTMKDHAQAASQIVKTDIQKLQDANKLADSNYSQLKIESARLEEHKNKSSCWMLLLLLFVFIVFIWMIIFMKIFPKPRS